MKKLRLVVVSSLLMAAHAAQAQDDLAAPVSPLTKGWYVAPMASYDKPDDRRDSDDGYGGVLAGGYRSGGLGLEVSGHYLALGSDDTKLSGVGGNALVFPFSSFDFFGLAGAGYQKAKDHPGPEDSFSAQYLQAGLGYIFPLTIGNYDFGIRAEALVRHSERSHVADDQDGPRAFNDFIFDLGLQLPLSAKPAPPPPEPVKVVPIADSDGDGVLDDVDECPGTPAGTVVNEKGCPLPKPVCNTPADGKIISLAGCASGDKIVLRGVNFEFDKSRLTVNAKTLLDGVGDELQAWPDVKIEIGGHTDSRGSDEYNQGLSEARAGSVQQYLAERGVAEDRMSSVGYGEAQPVDINDTDEGRELNRRVELKIVAAGSATITAPNTATTEGTTPAAAAPAEGVTPASEVPAAPADAAAEVAPAATTEPAAAEAPAAAPATDAPVTEAAPVADVPAADAAPAAEPAPAPAG